MRCPACRHPALEHDQACAQCGFSLEKLGLQLGIPPVLNAPITDVTRALSGFERRGVLETIRALHQRFPQVSFVAVIMQVPPEVPLAIQAFWLFNRGSLFSAVERAGENHGVLLLIDRTERQAVAMIGYGLEPFVSTLTLEVCTTAATGSLVRGQYGAAIQAFIRELERQFMQVIEPLPRIFGYDDKALWVSSRPDQGFEEVHSVAEHEDLY